MPTSLRRPVPTTTSRMKLLLSMGGTVGREGAVTLMAASLSGRHIISPHQRRMFHLSYLYVAAASPFSWSRSATTELFPRCWKSLFKYKCKNTQPHTKSQTNSYHIPTTDDQSISQIEERGCGTLNTQKTADGLPFSLL